MLDFQREKTILQQRKETIRTILSCLDVPIAHETLMTAVPTKANLTAIVEELMNENLLFKINNVYYSRKIMIELGFDIPKVIPRGSSIQNQVSDHPVYYKKAR